MEKQYRLLGFKVKGTREDWKNYIDEETNWYEQHCDAQWDYSKVKTRAAWTNAYLNDQLVALDEDEVKNLQHLNSQLLKKGPIQ